MSESRKRRGRATGFVAPIIIAAQVSLVSTTALAQDDARPADVWSASAADVRARFVERARPILEVHCFRCHGAEKAKAGVRLDLLTASLEGREPFLLEEVLEQLEDDAMPPEDEPRLSAEDSTALVEWLRNALETSEQRPQEKNGLVRRLTVSQYRNTLRELLGVDQDLAATLPPDAVSKDGFLNHVETQLSTPVHLEAWFEAAERALDLALVDENEKPLIQTIRLEIGAGLNPEPSPDQLILNGGTILPNADLVISEPVPEKPFAFDLFRMPTELRFIEGYAGNPTVRGWRSFSGIHHSIFGLTIGGARMIAEGVLLEPGRPGNHQGTGRLPWGPASTLTLSSRRLTDRGPFRITIEAARFDENPAPSTDLPEGCARAPVLGVHLGMRRDCGLTLARVGEPVPVTSREVRPYVFDGWMGDFPNPDVEAGNVNYLAGLREIAVRSEYTDGRTVPRLLVRAIEFEGPYYESWPPRTHRTVFFAPDDPDTPADTEAYAREVIDRFATRAFRRPITSEETTLLHAVQAESFADHGDFRESVRDALLVVLTSPQFLFLIEESSEPEPEPLAPYELASKLAYFLWDGPPDARLLELAAAGTLHDALDEEVERMIRDARFERFADAFTSQWLRLGAFDVLEVDYGRFGDLTQHARRELRREPIAYVTHLIRENRPARELVESDTAVMNEVVAAYYGLSQRPDQGFAFLPVKHEKETLGGVLTQAAVLAGLSDGREPNPVKRGAWLARKIVSEPPDDPPPNVPALPEARAESLTLRQRLERHRDQEGCRECHEKIDPWGLPLEEYDAGGRFAEAHSSEERVTLPDGTLVANAGELRRYLATERIDQVAFAFLKHLATYATGRGPTYHEIEYLKTEGRRHAPNGYPMRDLVRFVVKSPIFLEK